MGKNEASVISARVNGKDAGIVGRDGDDYIDISDYVQKGKNEIVLRVCGSFRNLFGPHLNYTDETVATGGDFYKHAANRINTASEYKMLNYGIYEDPKLFCSK